MYTCSTYTPENNSHGTVSQDISTYRTWRTQAWNNTIKTEYQKLAYHIKVGQTGTSCPKNRASFHRLHLKSIKLKNNNSTLTHHPLISLGTGAIKVWWGPWENTSHRLEGLGNELEKLVDKAWMSKQTEKWWPRQWSIQGGDSQRSGEQLQIMTTRAQNTSTWQGKPMQPPHRS